MEHMVEEAASFRTEAIQKLRSLGNDIQEIMKEYKKAEEDYKADHSAKRKGMDDFLKDKEKKKAEVEVRYQQEVKNYEKKVQTLLESDDEALEEAEIDFWEKLGELTKDIQALEEIIETTKKRKYFPEELGYLYATGANGVYVAARDFWLHDLRGEADVQVTPAKWEYCSATASTAAPGSRAKKPGLSTSINDIPNFSHPFDIHAKLKSFPTVNLKLSFSASLRLYGFGLKGEKGTKIPDTKIRELALSADAVLHLPLYFVPASSSLSHRDKSSLSGKEKLACLTGVWKLADDYKFELSELTRKQHGGIHVPRKMLQWVVNLIVPAQVKEVILPLIPIELGALLCLSDQKFNATIKFSLSSLPSSLLDAPLNNAKETEVTKKWRAQPANSAAGCQFCLPPMCSVAGVESLTKKEARQDFMKHCKCDTAVPQSGPEREISNRVDMATCDTGELSLVACQWMGITIKQAQALIESQTFAGFNPPMIGCLSDAIQFLNRYCPKACYEAYASGLLNKASSTTSTGRTVNLWNKLLNQMQQVLDSYMQVKLFEHMSKGGQSNTNSQKVAQGYQLDILDIFRAAIQINKQPFLVQVYIGNCDGSILVRSNLLVIQEVMRRRLREYYQKKTGLSAKYLKRIKMSKKGSMKPSSSQTKLSSRAAEVARDGDSPSCDSNDGDSILGDSSPRESFSEMHNQGSRQQRTSSQLSGRRESLRGAEGSSEIADFTRGRKLSEAGDSVASQPSRATKTFAQREEQITDMFDSCDRFIGAIQPMFKSIHCHGCTQLRGGADGYVDLWTPFTKVRCNKGAAASFPAPTTIWGPYKYYMIFQSNEKGFYSFSVAYPTDSESSDEEVIVDGQSIAIETFAKLYCSSIRSILQLDMSSLVTSSPSGNREPRNDSIVTMTLSGGQQGKFTTELGNCVIPVVEIYGGGIHASLVKLGRHLPSFLQEMVREMRVGPDESLSRSMDDFRGCDSEDEETDDYIAEHAPSPESRGNGLVSSQLNEKIQEYLSRYDFDLWFGADSEVLNLVNDESTGKGLFLVDHDIALNFVSSNAEDLRSSSGPSKQLGSPTFVNPLNESLVASDHSRQFLNFSAELWLRDIFEDLFSPAGITGNSNTHATGTPLRERDLVMEKHWRDKTPRTCLDQFWEEVAQHPRREDVPPVLPSTRHYLVNVYRYNMFFVGVLVGDVSSLFVVELLHRIVDTLEHYLDFNVSEKTIRRQFSVVYQLLEEMVDNGYPLITEPNALRTMIKPPTFSHRVSAFMTGSSSTTDTIGQSALGVIPWRKTDVKYANNEIFFDILEDVDCILDSNGSVVSHTTRGSIECNCHLTGTPDLLLYVNDPKVLDDAYFHPCVRLSKFERENTISFIPPDGRFRLASYQFPSKQPTIPVYCRPEIHCREGGARVRFVLGKKPVPVRAATSSSSLGTSLNTNDTQVEGIALVIRFPSAVTDVDIASENEGKVLYDNTTKTLTWTMDKFPKEGIPSIVGNVAFQPGQKKPPMEGISATLHFVVPNTTESGLAVRDVKMTKELYRFQSASRCALRSGTFQIRCNWQ